MCLGREFIYSVKKPRTFLFSELETVIQLLSPSSLVMVGERAEGEEAWLYFVPFKMLPKLCDMVFSHTTISNKLKFFSSGW